MQASKVPIQNDNATKFMTETNKRTDRNKLVRIFRCKRRNQPVTVHAAQCAERSQMGLNFVKRPCIAIHLQGHQGAVAKLTLTEIRVFVLPALTC